jgi:hypothetical protein
MFFVNTLFLLKLHVVIFSVCAHKIYMQENMNILTINMYINESYKHYIRMNRNVYYILPSRRAAYKINVVSAQICTGPLFQSMSYTAHTYSHIQGAYTHIRTLPSIKT